MPTFWQENLKGYKIVIVLKPFRNKQIVHYRPPHRPKDILAEEKLG